jgi:Mce-associated membrane protein
MRSLKVQTDEEAKEVNIDDIEAEGESPEIDETGHDDQPVTAGHGTRWSRVSVLGALPVLVMLLAAAAGFMKFQDASARDADTARAESVRAATDSTIALLSYRHDTVQQDLEAAQTRLTGTFLDSYTKLTHDVVIPGAKQKEISAVATVPAAASASATADHAVVLLFVNQTVLIGKDVPTNTASSVRVTLDKINGRWLVSGFDPV